MHIFEPGLPMGIFLRISQTIDLLGVCVNKLLRIQNSTAQVPELALEEHHGRGTSRVLDYVFLEFFKIFFQLFFMLYIFFEPVYAIGNARQMHIDSHIHFLELVKFLAKHFYCTMNFLFLLMSCHI